MLKKIEFLFLIFVVIFSNVVFGNATQYVWSNSVEETMAEEGKDILNLESESAILIEQNSGQVLYEKNAHEQLRPASVTKLMSILLIFEALESRTNNYRRPSTLQRKRCINGRLTNLV